MVAVQADIHQSRPMMDLRHDRFENSVAALEVSMFGKIRRHQLGNLVEDGRLIQRGQPPVMHHDPTGDDHGLDRGTVLRIDQMLS